MELCSPSFPGIPPPFPTFPPVYPHPSPSRTSPPPVPCSRRQAGNQRARLCRTQASEKVNANEPLQHASPRRTAFSMHTWFPQPSGGMLILFLHFMSLREGINFLGIIRPSGESLVQRHFPHKCCPEERLY